jgi:hypothetical protein
MQRIIKESKMYDEEESEEEEEEQSDGDVSMEDESNEQS